MSRFLTSTRGKCFHTCPYNKPFEVFQAANAVFLFKTHLTYVNIGKSCRHHDMQSKSQIWPPLGAVSSNLYFNKGRPHDFAKPE
jgi:hypothetical protein